MIGAIRTFYGIPASHKALFLKIGLLVPLTEIGIRTFGFKRTVRFLEYFAREKKKPSERPQVLINRHSNYLYLFKKNFPFFGKCLAHSLSLWFILKKKGVSTDLRFGMKKQEGGLLAHAWLEFEGKPLASKSELEEDYTFFPDSILTKIG